MTQITDSAGQSNPIDCEKSPTVSDVDTLVESFCSQPAFSDATKTTYHYEVGEILRCLTVAGLANPLVALCGDHSRDLLPFIVAMHATMAGPDGYAEASCAQRMAIGRSFCRFLTRVGVREGSNPFEMVELPAIDQKRQHRPTHSIEDVRRIFRVVEQEKNALLRHRDLAMIGLMARVGLRRNEVITLAMSDADAGLKTFLVHGKGRKTRRVGVDSKTRADIEAYLALDGRKLDGSGAMLFRTTTTKLPIAARTMSQLTHNYAEAAGVSSASCHAFRRAFATTAYRSGVPIEKISLAMGHSSTETTRRYIENILIESEAVTVDF